jgi:hypothetical protein
MNPECPNTNRRNALRIRQSKLAKKFMDIQSKQSKVLPRIAIIGAGMAGLSLANLLENHADTTLFEKSAGVGGRMSTRYAGAYQFDHGAQYFTARSKAFQGFLAPMLAAGVVRTWQPSVLTLGGDKKPYKRNWFESHYVATPKMNQLGKALAKGKNLLLKTEIAEIQQCERGWSLRDSNGNCHQYFDWVIVTTPSPQAAKLLPGTFSCYQHIEQAEMAGCYSLMIGLAQPLQTRWQAAVVKESCIGWIAINSSKPLRTENFSLVVHSTNEWAEQHIEDDQGNVEQILTRELERLLGAPLNGIEYKRLHRWRYASTRCAPEENCLIDPDLKLGVCADWLIHGHVESAFLSAQELSQKIINLINERPIN